jgi:rare lipoprotein A
MQSIRHHTLCLFCCLVALTACGRHTVHTPHPTPGKQESTLPGTQRPYVIDGKAYYPLPSADGYTETGIASWYGEKFHGRKTAGGERYNMYAKTAAHKTLPISTMLLVTNLENGKKIVVRVNDRGPFVKSRIIDLTLAGAQELGMLKNGTAPVRIEALGETRTSYRNNRQVEEFLPHGDFATGDFYVQIGSFTNPLNAERLKNTMQTLGNQTVVQVYDDGDAPYYRVQVRAGATLDNAKHKEQALAESGYFGFVVAR